MGVKKKAFQTDVPAVYKDTGGRAAESVPGLAAQGSVHGSHAASFRNAEPRLAPAAALLLTAPKSRSRGAEKQSKSRQQAVSAQGEMAGDGDRAAASMTHVYTWSPRHFLPMQEVLLFLFPPMALSLLLLLPNPTVPGDAVQAREEKPYELFARIVVLVS